MNRFRSPAARRPRASGRVSLPRLATTTRVEPLESRLLFVAGELDFNFSVDGKQFTNFGDTETARGVVVQPDGKTVVVGDWDGGSADFAITRYNPNGTLDTTFNDLAIPGLGFGDGRQNVYFGATIGAGVEKATAVALQSDGKIVVVGYTNFTGTGTNFDFAVARLNPDGTLDNTFSGDGKFTHNFGNDDRANAVAIQPDGKIVVAGQWDGGSSDFAVIRLNSNGTLDTTFNDVALPTAFNGDGKAHVNFGFITTERATSVALALNGDIVVGGYTDFGAGGFGNTNDFAVARLTTNGVLNLSFSDDGKQTVDFGYNDQANAVTLDRRQRILLAGFDDGSSADIAVARLEPDGDLDPTFNDLAAPTFWNGDGRLSFNVGNTERAFAIALEPNGIDQEIYVAGFTRASALAADNFVLARIRPNGTLDTGFGGGDGIQITDMGGDDKAYGMAIGADGKVVVAGASGGDFAVARYLAELDPAFGFDGKQTLDWGDTDTARAVAVQPNGAVVVAGDWDGGSADFAIARFTAGGASDGTFGAGTGKVNLTFGAFGFGGVERATAVALQSDGKIVVAGYTDAGAGGRGNPFDFAVARLNADGTLDATFSGDGRFTHNFGHDDRANAVAIQPDGKIVVVGQWDGGSSDFAIIRLDPDGTLDTTFNDVALPTAFSGDGKQHVAFSALFLPTAEYATAVALKPDGRIVVAGYTNLGGAAPNPNDFAVAVLNADGTLDATFSGDGRFTVDFGSDDRATSVVVRPDGRVVVGGSADDGASDFAVAQIRGDNLDALFGGGDGKLELLTNDAVEFSTGMALMENGKLVMVGYSNSSTGSPNNFVVARVLADGSSADPSFNADGEHFIDFGADDKAYAVAIQPDRKVVVVGTSGGNFAVARLDSAPVVTRVYVNSTAWSPAFRAHLAARGLGSVDFGYAIPAGGGQLNELPWINVNEITITFSEFVSVDFDDLAVRGVNTPVYAMNPAGFVITPPARAATWRLPAGTVFNRDKLMLDLNGDGETAVRTTSGAVLDGDWSGLNEVYPSGDGAAGGDFRFRINLLPGDADRNGTVLATDYSEVKKKFFKNTTSPVTGTDVDYSPFHDVDGSGTILATDYAEVKRRFFNVLPGPNPTALPPLAGESSLFGTERIRAAGEVLG